MRLIALDIETYDPNLQTLGDGSIRKDGRILCCGAVGDGIDTVFDFDNPNDIKQLKDLLKDESIGKIFHNGVYDLAWLNCGYGFEVNGPVHDTMTRQSLIDEYMDLDLDTCCKRMGVQGKNFSETVEAWFEEHKKEYGFKGKVWQNSLLIWQSPVGKQMMMKYCRQDCNATRQLFDKQAKWIMPMQEAYDMETKLYPLLMHMKRNGVRIDENKLSSLTETVSSELASVVSKLEHEWGILPEMVNSTKQLGEAMHRIGIKSPLLTAKGAESWSSAALDRLQEHEAVREVQHYKILESLLTKYLQGSLATSLVNGRIHCTFSPCKRDDGGTITGRFACKNPNLQNIPSRTEKHGWKSYGGEMRSLFIPNDGCLMFACDYSQIEYLLLAHFAYGPQADWFRKQANDGVDFHTVVQTAMHFPNRNVVKTLNYGKMYGLGVTKMAFINYVLFSKLAAEKGMDLLEYCNYVNSMYEERMPVIKDTMMHIQTVAKMQGYVESLSGRRHHKPKPFFDKEKGRWNDGIYKMTNYLIQGSASDILKRGLLDAWEQGIFDVLTMHVTVHDENVCSVPNTKEGIEAAVAFEACMNNAYKDRLLVPMKAVGGIGDSWCGKHFEDDWQALRVKNGYGKSGAHEGAARIVEVC